MIVFVFLQYYYRKCNEIRFCKDNMNSAHPIISINKSTISFNSNFYQANLLVNDEESPYVLELYKINGTGFRMRINPGENLSSYRFDITHDNVIIDKTKLETRATITRTHKSSYDILAENNGTKAVISFYPFSITFSRNNVKYFTVNSENFMFVENGEHLDDTEYNGFNETYPHGKTAVGIHISYLSPNVRLTGFAEGTYKANLEDTYSSSERRYTRDNYAMYGVVPVLVGHCTEFYYNPTFFWMNPSDTYIQINTKSDSRVVKIVSEGGFIDVIFFIDLIQNVLIQYGHLTGIAPLPPAFAFGYHQSKYGYPNQSKVEEVIQGLKDVDFPFDAVWLDIDHLYNFQPLRINYTWFPTPKEFFGNLSAENRFVIRITDPHLPVDETHKAYVEAYNNSYLILDSKGEQVIAPCWPGNSSWPDFYLNEIREWWGKQFLYDAYPGEWATNVYIWNDMNEIAVFDRIEGTNHKDWTHNNGTLESREFHNAYGLFMTEGTHRGLIKRGSNNLRPFILTRSFFAGSQKYAWHWSGDNDASWEHLQLSIDMLITANMNGLPYTGSDIGGFTGNVTDQLHARWFEAAAYLYPFFRQHAGIDVNYREPYLYKGTDLFNIMRAMAVDRYKLIPLWYTAAYRHTFFSEPVVAPMWFYYPEVEEFHDVRFQAVVGGRLMPCPVVTKDATSVHVVKPPGRWFNWETGEEFKETADVSAPLETIPVFMKGGTVVATYENAMGTVKQTMDQNIILHIALDENYTASGDLFFDDGKSFEYLSGKFIVENVKYADGILEIKSDSKQATNIQNKFVTLKVYGAHKADDVKVTGDKETNDTTGVVTVTGLNISVGTNYKSSARTITGLIVGVVMVIIALVSVVVFGVWWFLLRQRTETPKPKLDDDKTMELQV